MTGIGKTATSVSPTGTPLIDGVLSGSAWTGAVTYAFPARSGAYGYGPENTDSFAAVSAAQRSAARFAMDINDGKGANDGFSIEGFTAVDITAGTSTSANIRLAQSATPPTAYAFYPGTYDSAGDIWFGTAYAGGINDYRKPVAGNYAWQTMLHEIGHAFGLKHGHESPSLPANNDSLEYSVMTYRSYIGGTASVTYENYGAPQTYMMADIAALQHMYGADFSTNSGKTVYRWTPDNGRTYVNGEVAITPGANRIFATIWDGGGVDTYDLSRYATDLRIDLRPGRHSVFDDDQLAYLGGGPNSGYARGNIFNALQYDGDPRSLIENAFGGSGDDLIFGNQAENALRGGGGSDRLNGLRGNDTFIGGTGRDVFVFTRNSDRDTVRDFTDGTDRVDLSSFDFGSKQDALARVRDAGSDVVFLFGHGDRLTLRNVDIDDLGAGDIII